MKFIISKLLIKILIQRRLFRKFFLRILNKIIINKKLFYQKIRSFSLNKMKSNVLIILVLFFFLYIYIYVYLFFFLLYKNKLLMIQMKVLLDFSENQVKGTEVLKCWNLWKIIIKFLLKIIRIYPKL